MQNEVKRISDRFSALFEKEGLTNVKFFVRDADNLKLSEFLVQVTKIQDTIAAGSFRVASKPSLLPTAISEVAWSKTSDGPLVKR